MEPQPNQILVGRTITAIYLAEDKKAVRFDLDGGESIIAKADGDCCSSTWIENMENWEALIGVPVAAAEDIAMPVAEKRTDDSLLQFYGFKLTTSKGECVIDYRNESNGYYGGNLSWPEEHFYGGVNDQNVSKEEWRPIGG